MKLNKTVGLSVAVLAAAAFTFSGCNQANSADTPKVKETYTEEQLGLRNVDLMDENVIAPAKTQYSESYAGSGKLYERAFQDAPPMIPHSVEGMLPITINNNQCVACHMPAVASAVNATSIPESHFYDMRPKHNFDGQNFQKAVDNMKNETSVRKVSDLAGARFNCSQCHAPQSEGDVEVVNTFEAEFTTPEGNKKSSWQGSKLYEGLDTIME
jgi:cytochrome c-type protein NapB